MNSNEKYNVWKTKIKDKKIVAKLNKMTEDEIKNNFSSNLEFGTAGMRGTMELGTNNINELTVCKLAKSVATYMQNHMLKNAVICFDTRLNSKKFANLFSKVLCLNKIKVNIFKHYAPTPLCVYATTKLKSDIGVMITASHNQKNYNGIKIYANDGIQINDATQQEISKIFNKIDEIEVFNSVYKFKNNNLITYIDRQMEDEFVSFVNKTKVKNLKIVYTPLNGTGYYCVKKLLNNNGFKFKVPKSQKNGNGYFKTCSYPNPEFVEAFNVSINLAKKTNADIIVATDPDADRIGVVVKHNNSYVKLTGNEVGYIFADYKLKNNKDKDKFVVTSVVTSPLINDICNYYKSKLFKTLTGFMSLGTKAKECCEKFGQNAFCLCYEESCGYVVKNSYFDKDGIYATLLICEIAEQLKQQNKTLVDYLNEIYKNCGYVCSISDSIKFSGINSKQIMQEKIENLRKNKLTKINNMDIVKTIDYQFDETGLNKQNFIEYIGQNFSFILRPSGTEPKLKIYLFYKDNNIELANKKASELFEEVKKLVLWTM